MNRFEAIVIWLDQGISAVVLASPDETFSAAAYRLSLTGSKRWRLIVNGIDRLFFWQEAHCRTAWERERLRAHFPTSYRTNR